MTQYIESIYAKLKTNMGTKEQLWAPTSLAITMQSTSKVSSCQQKLLILIFKNNKIICNTESFGQIDCQHMV